MSGDRWISVQYCDDVRQEVGNKYSLMGCYADVMVVSPMPALLPRFCAMIRVQTPVERPLEKLVLRLMRDGVSLHEIEFPQSDLLNLVKAPVGAKGVSLATMFMISPFPIEAPCVLRVEAETEDGSLRGGILRITNSEGALPPIV
jgi:hypothetical protein